MIHLRHVAAASAIALALPLAVMPLAVPSAHARIVFDPSNYAENVLQAARALEQINNQIASLQNEAQMLINEARNLANLPYSSLQQLQSSIQRTQQLLAQAQNVAFDVQEIDRAFATTYAPATANQSDQALIANAQDRWWTSVGAFEDALKVQAGVAGNIETSRTEMSVLVSASQSATGALQAAQAGNQLLALQAQQLADLTAAIVAQGRAQSLESSQRTAAQDQAHEQLRRFLAPGSGYQPQPVQMFHQ